jgi:phospholipase/carboxylesterase/glyoxalase family protein
VSVLSFTHVHHPPSTPGGPTLLLLHGTGGNEHDLVPLAAELLPGAGVLSPRGKVLERGMPRFFRRLAEGVFDLDDLRQRTVELADFIEEAGERYQLDASRIVAVGFSNGANIAASLLLLSPGTLQRAVLFRAMVPIVPQGLPSVPSASVLISNGRVDPLVPVAETDRLAQLLTSTGAQVQVSWQQAGHQLVRGDVSTAAAWLRRQSF